MGYTTEFQGSFKLNKKLDPKTHTFLKKLAETRRMARRVDPKYGVEGEFYVDGKGFMGQDEEPNIVNYNKPPSTQPSLWCQWTPSEDGTAIVWDQGEKFYNYIEWVIYICNKILTPRGYSITGNVKWRGEDFNDTGTIHAIDNLILVNEEYEKIQALSIKAGCSIKKFLKNKKNLPTLLGLSEHINAWISNQLKQ